MSKTYSKTRILVECALMIAIGTALSNIKFFTLPNGGSVTLLSMLPFVLVSFRHGAKWGLFTGFVNACLQMIMGFYPPPASTFLYFLGEVLLDYVLAFMALGLAELFARPFKNRTVGVAVGTFAAGFLRFMCSFLSGVLIWGNLSDGLPAWTYSLTYNGSYMLPETIMTTIAAASPSQIIPLFISVVSLFLLRLHTPVLRYSTGTRTLAFNICIKDRNYFSHTRNLGGEKFSRQKSAKYFSSIMQ